MKGINQHIIIKNASLFKNLKIIKEVKNGIASHIWTWDITNVVKSLKQYYDFLNNSDKCKL